MVFCNKVIFLKNAILLIAVIALLFAAAANAQDISVIINDVSPQPVEPGKDLTLRVTFTNNRDDFIKNLPAFVELGYPFSLKSSTENFENGFDICGSCVRTNSYFISVDTSAKSGTYPIFVRVGNSGFLSTKIVNVTVRGRPNIVLFSDAVANATPSKSFDLKINITNIGTGFASEIKIASRSTDFVVIGGSVVTVNQVGPASMSSVKIAMSPSEDLNAGSYNLPFEIVYKDEFGNQYNTTQNIGVRVVNEGLLNIESIKAAAASGRAVAGQPVSVIIRLENIGHGDANSIEAKLSCDNQEIKAFLGQLKRDEDAPAVFDITFSRGGKHECTLTTEYWDDTGSKTVENSFDLNIANPELPVLPIVVVIIIVGFFYYRRTKKRTRKKEAVV